MGILRSKSSFTPHQYSSRLYRELQREVLTICNFSAEAGKRPFLFGSVFSVFTAC